MNRVKITAPIAALVIMLVGFVTFFSSLGNQFVGDDSNQIINNEVVHSFSNFGLFFQGGTFYNGQGQAPLTGVYYRPLMVTWFSAIYSLFGDNPAPFHIFQLLLHVLGTIVLYLFLRYTFKPTLALMLALIFLVHPLNSQAVFSNAAVQEPLFFLFGITAMWLFLRFSSVRSLGLVIACLFLSLLSKETGVLFVVMAAVYLIIFNRQRLFWFLGIISLPLVIYLVLKIHAVGLLANPNNAPITELNLPDRLLTAPSIVVFFFGKFVWPLALASGYYWTRTSISFGGVIVPLIVDTAVIGLFVYAGSLVRNRLPKTYFFTYIFFGIWAGLGLITHLQIAPLDMTACETWFYFTMVGFLGMIGLGIKALPFRVSRKWGVALAIVLIGGLSARTALRGPDWSDDFTLARHDITMSKDDYIAENIVAINLSQQGDLREAKDHALKSVRMYPTSVNNNTLGIVLAQQGDYQAAADAFKSALKYQAFDQPYNNLAAIMVIHGSDPNTAKEFIRQGLTKFPQDAKLWLYLAIADYQTGATDESKQAIAQAATYSSDNDIQRVEYLINNNLPLNVGVNSGPK